MGHYEERLENDLKGIIDSIERINKLVVQAVKNSVDAFVHGNRNLGYETILNDKVINRMVKSLDKSCYSFISRHLPSGIHLRFISSAMRVGIELERIGDYATSICRQLVHLDTKLDEEIIEDFVRMSSVSIENLGDAVSSFISKDEESARRASQNLKEVSSSFDRVYEKLLVHEASNKQLFTALTIFSMMLRVADQGRNVCYETFFTATGEIDPVKTYPILFLDKDNTCLGKIAAAVARRNFPGCSEFSARGLNQGDEVDPNLVSFLSRHGISLRNPTPIKLSSSELENYYIIICLEGSVEDYNIEIPYHSIALEWNIGAIPVPKSNEEEAFQAYETIYRELVSKVRELMVVLCGEEGSCE